MHWYSRPCRPVPRWSLLSTSGSCRRCTSRVEPQRLAAGPATRAAHGSALRWLVPSLILLALVLLHAASATGACIASVRRRVLEQRLHDVTANLPAVVYQARRSATGHYSLAQIAGDVQALFGVSVELRGSTICNCWPRCMPTTAAG